MTHTQTNSTTRRATLGGAAAVAAAALGVGLPAKAGAAAAGRRTPGPRIGILLYDGFSLLDPTGPAEVLSRLPGATVTMLAERRGPVPVRTDTGDVAVVADRSLAEAGRLDVVLVPGAGNDGTIAAMENPAILRFLRQAHRHTRWTTSVCTGSLVLGAAGLLGERATTYWASKDYLESAFGVTYVPERYVHDGRIITAAGVSAGLDLALYLAALLTGDTIAQAAQLAVEYDPHPPFDAGNAAEATPERKELALRLLEESQRRVPPGHSRS
ncbi:DJ-1/PfpI family protein [Streptomyces hoynatensis]|uniref:DJ-1/PfpI family protein n=1 Tax=Streptomyces hoynatensis TaxID=1141874 RepID=A0A3A9YWS6_9ACTN|nr:DJ-1/PfpI family protein [Streptomyces hoynatensis]RKN40340.1 DJ-1/PfpI family protein [Streptomyces hoynatensis]